MADSQVTYPAAGPYGFLVVDEHNNVTWDKSPQACAAHFMADWAENLRTRYPEKVGCLDSAENLDAAIRGLKEDFKTTAVKTGRFARLGASCAASLAKAAMGGQFKEAGKAAAATLLASVGSPAPRAALNASDTILQSPIVTINRARQQVGAKAVMDAIPSYARRPDVAAAFAADEVPLENDPAIKALYPYLPVGKADILQMLATVTQCAGPIDPAIVQSKKSEQRAGQGFSAGVSGPEL